MKKYLIMIMTTLLVVFISCNSNSSKNDEKEVREAAKTEIINRYDLPEGTEFTEENMRINRNSDTNTSMDDEYIVRVTITSQNRAGEMINESHVMHYKKRENAMKAKERWELMSFE